MSLASGPGRAAAPAGASLLLVLALGGCLAPPAAPPTPPPEPAAPVTYTILRIGEPESLDPAYDYEVGGGAVLQQVVEPLVYYNKASTSELLPVLVEEVPGLGNGLLSADGLRYTFRVKPGVTFHDGSRLTATDVKFSLDRPVLMNDPASPAWISGSIRGAEGYMASRGTQGDRDAYFAAGGVEVVDPMTVRVTLERPDAAFLFKMAFVHGSIVPRGGFLAPHAERVALWGVPATLDGLPPPALDLNRDGDLDDPGDRKAVTRDPWADRGVAGTGPFVLRSWSDEGEVVLERFADYHGWPKPTIDRVVFRKVEDAAERMRLLAEGRADDVYVDVRDVDRLRGLPGVRVTENPSLSVTVLLFTYHIADPAACPVDAATQRPDCDFFDDLPMRKAFAHAFDYDRFLREVAGGHAIQLTGVVPKRMFGYDESLRGYQHDRALALAELAISRHPAGFSLEVAYNQGNALRQGAAELLKEGLESLAPGIEVRLRAVDFSSELLPMARQGALAATFIGWAPDYAFPDDYVVPFGHSTKGTFAKLARLADPALDALIEDALATVAPAQLEVKYRDIQRRMLDNHTYLFLYQPNDVHVEGDWVEGYYYNPMDANQPHMGHLKYAAKRERAPADGG